MRTSGTRRDSLHYWMSLTCSYETERIGEDRDGLAHNPEVAGSNPVPATKEVALTRPNGRQHQLAAASFCERCECVANGVRRSYAVDDGDGPCYRWVTLPSCTPHHCGGRWVARGDGRWVPQSCR
jgi:hypothetical protein